MFNQIYAVQLYWTQMPIKRLISIFSIVFLVLILFCPLAVFGYAGLGGYAGELILGGSGGADGSLYLGSSGDSPVVIGYEAATPTTPATSEAWELLMNILTIVIALAILIAVLGLTGNPIAALIAVIIGLIAFYFVRAIIW